MKNSAARIIDRAVRNLPHSMDESFNPNGSYPEGVGYWNYGTTYNVMLIDMIQNALGDDFGLLDQPGFSLTGDYYHSAHSPMGRPFSHNTLTINGDRQRVDGFARIVDFSADRTHPHSVVDMSSAYQGRVQSARRGIQLFHRSHLIVCDRLEQFTGDSEVRWAMTTPAAIRIESPRKAVLTSGSKKLTAHLVEPEEAHWEVLDISTGPRPWDAANPGIQQLVFKSKGAKDSDMNLTVILETGHSRAPTPAQAGAWKFAAP